MGKKRMNLVLTPRQHYILEEESPETFYDKKQSLYHFWRRLWERTNLALDELILVANCMPNKYMRKTFDYEKLERLLQKIAAKPQISKPKLNKAKKPEYVKDEALFRFCMSVVRDMNLEARNLVKEDVLEMSKYKAPLFLSPQVQAVLTTLFYAISPKEE